MTPDSELIKKAITGDARSFALLIDRHKSYVFTLALRFVKNREDAEEIAQDAFVKAYRSLATYRGDSKFTTWMYTITFNTAMSFKRSKKLETTSIDERNTHIQLHNTESDYRPETALEQQSLKEHLNEAIDKLSTDDASIITLFYQGEQSLDEIAVVFGTDVNNTKVRLFRARQRLKTVLESMLKPELNEWA